MNIYVSIIIVIALVLVLIAIVDVIKAPSMYTVGNYLDKSSNSNPFDNKYIIKILEVRGDVVKILLLNTNETYIKNKNYIFSYYNQIDVNRIDTTYDPILKLTHNGTQKKFNVFFINKKYYVISTIQKVDKSTIENEIGYVDLSLALLSKDL